jgi:hypothetical protein
MAVKMHDWRIWEALMDEKGSAGQRNMGGGVPGKQ